MKINKGEKNKEKRKRKEIRRGKRKRGRGRARVFLFVWRDGSGGAERSSGNMEQNGKIRATFGQCAEH